MGRIKYTFEQWCIENNRQDVLNRWDYELNDRNPSDIGSSSNRKKYYLKCPKGIHKSEQKNIGSFVTLGQEGSVCCIGCNSFKQWCYDNLSKEKADEILLRWDTEKNGCLPYEVSYASSKKYWFKCLKHREHESELKSISDFTNGHIGSLSCNQCNSFAQWGIDNLGEDFLEKYWDYEKNKEIDPWKVSWGAHNYRVWIICQEKDYHGSYETFPNSFTSENRCSYCGGKKVHIMDSVGNLYPKSLMFWSNKNEKSPYEYLPKANRKVWWKCPDGIHKDFKRSVSESTLRSFRCPECDYSKGENKISKFLISKNIEYIPQKEFNGLIGVGRGNLSYDFYLPLHNLLIEYDGEFHYRAVMGKEHFKKQQEHDRRKNEFAKNNDIKLLRIPYWEFDNIENILNKQIINNK